MPGSSDSQLVLLLRNKESDLLAELNPFLILTEYLPPTYDRGSFAGAGMII